MPDQRNNQISPDRPLQHPEQDRLGYAAFAEWIAQCIQDVPATEGLVIALYGPWGSGKSSVLAFVKHYLDNLPKTDRPILVPFNPWWFSGDEDLVRHFFDELRVSFRSGLHTASNEVAKAFSKYADVISEVQGAKIFSAFVRARRQPKTVASLKEDVGTALTLDLDAPRIVVMIDDIDRLSSQEIKQLFRVVRAIADFPNVIYFLAFDRQVVTAALGDVQGLSGSDYGSDYLDKIVQLPLELPIPEHNALQDLFVERVNEIMAGIPDYLFSQQHWEELYINGIERFLTTPRSVLRLLNALSVTYPLARAEVNPTEFIAIESLRLFAPTVYDAIRNNPDRFIGNYTGSLLPGDLPKRKSLYEDLIESLPNKLTDPVIHLLEKLFPMFRSIWSETHNAAGWDPQWRRELRVCTGERFHAYFRLAAPRGSLSNAEMQDILSHTGDSAALSERIEELTNRTDATGVSLARGLLFLLGDYAEEQIPTGHIHEVVRELIDTS